MPAKRQQRGLDMISREATMRAIPGTSFTERALKRSCESLQEAGRQLLLADNHFEAHVSRVPTKRRPLTRQHATSTLPRRGTVTESPSELRKVDFLVNQFCVMNSTNTDSSSDCDPCSGASSSPLSVKAVSFGSDTSSLTSLGDDVLNEDPISPASSRLPVEMWRRITAEASLRSLQALRATNNYLCDVVAPDFTRHHNVPAGTSGKSQVIWATSAYEVAGLVSMLRKDSFKVPLAIFVQFNDPRCAERFIAFCRAGIANCVAFHHLEIDLSPLSPSSKTIMPILAALNGLSVRDLDIRIPTGRTRAYSIPLILAACCRVRNDHYLKLTGTSFGATFPCEWPTSCTQALHLDIKIEQALWERLLGLMSFPSLFEVEIHDDLPAAAAHDFLARHQSSLSYVTLHGSALHTEKSTFREVLSLKMFSTLQVTISFAAVLLGRAVACNINTLALVCDKVMDLSHCTQVWERVREITSLNVLSVPVDLPLAFYWPLDGQGISLSVSVLEVVAGCSVDCCPTTQLTIDHLERARLWLHYLPSVRTCKIYEYFRAHPVDRTAWLQGLESEFTGITFERIVR